MAVKDYNVDPDLNTTIEGINIAEGCPPSGINNAIRQLMADVKEESEAQAQAVEQAVEQARNAAASDATAKVSTLDSTLREFIEQEVSGAESSAKAAVSELSTELSALETEVEGKADAATVDEKLEGVVRSVNGVSADAAGNVPLDQLTFPAHYSTVIKFSSGLMILTGSVVNKGNESTRITFPAPFTNNPTVCVSLQDSLSFGGVPCAIGISTTGFSFGMNWPSTVGQSLTIRKLYIAIGAWK